MSYENQMSALGELHCNRATAAYHYRRLRRRSEYAGANSPFDRLVSTNNLIRCFWTLASTGGQGAGVDGVAYRDLCGPEIADILRKVSAELQAGDYRTSPVRTVMIPKENGHSHRALQLQTVIDRAVARALLDDLAYLAARLWTKNLYGISGRGTHAMLARVATFIESADRPIIGTDDIEQAFDRVRRAAVVSAFERLLTAPRVARDRARYLDLIREILFGGDRQAKRGIPQGSPLSMLALNLVLHFSLDLHHRNTGSSTGHILRYVDDLFVVGDDPVVVLQRLHQAERLLSQAGLSLHAAPDRVQDVQVGGTTEVLGLLLTREDGKARYRLSHKAWVRLVEKLEETHHSSDPPKRAQQVVKGWIDAYGPACETADALLIRLHDLIGLHGYSIERTQISNAMHAAHQRWQEALAKQGRKRP